MWSYYGNDYKSICCEFPFQKIVYDIPSIRCFQYDKYIYEYIDSINYVDNFNPNIKINCKKLLRIPIKKIAYSKYIIDCVKASLLIKQSQWKCEKEVRLIIRNDDANVDIVEKFDNNSVMESFFASMKREELYRRKFKSENEFYKAVADYIIFYNEKHPHYQNSYRTPLKKEQDYYNSIEQK